MSVPPSTCANCGAAIPRRAKACPECGADERTGWRDASIYDGLDLPETAYGDEQETPTRRPRRVNGVAWYWWVVGLLLVAALITTVLGLR